MPQAVTVYRWDDPGAPQMGSTDYWPGILNILKKCLVEGYGTKNPAGWTVEYEDGPGNKCVFRNDPAEGSGGYVQFQKQTGTQIAFKSATSMTGIDEFINSGYFNNLFTGSSAATQSDGLWTLIASKTAFYFTIARNTAAAATMAPDGVGTPFSIFCGDLVSTLKNDPSMFISYGMGTGSFSTSTTSQFSGEGGIFSSAGIPQSTIIGTTGGVNTRINLPLSANGDVTNTEHLVVAPANATFTSQAAVISSTPPLGQVLLLPLLLCRRTGANSEDPNLPNVRGYFPGCYCLPSTYYSDSSIPFQSVVEINTRQYVLQKFVTNSATVGGGARNLIDITSWELPNRD